MFSAKFSCFYVKKELKVKIIKSHKRSRKKTIFSLCRLCRINNNICKGSDTIYFGRKNGFGRWNTEKFALGDLIMFEFEI